MKYSLLVFLFLSGTSHASCIIHESKRTDVISMIVETAPVCPKDVGELKKLLKDDGLNALPSLVANRGFHNPDQGSFSIFESVKGHSHVMRMKILPEHFYFGHFTGLNSRKEIVLDQESQPNKLLIEVIAYDFEKGVYNFYELTGTPLGPQWFYRGNSFDAFEDNKMLKIGERPQFGTRMRCSACHTSGGPIMKELSYPHNDWWTKARGLPFGQNKPSLEMEKYLEEFIDASDFSKNVHKGILLLEKKNILSSRTLKEKLRPLFCSTEINLKSDAAPVASLSNQLEIPSEIFIDPFLVKPGILKMKKDQYLRALSKLNSKFPEINLVDADHAFLAPIKGLGNHLQIEALVTNNIIDEEFMLDVLSIDFKNPLFSTSRCSLLKLVPEGNQWKETFRIKLLEANTLSSVELAEKMKISNGQLHINQAMEYLVQKQNSWTDGLKVVDEVRNLNILRNSVFKDQISQNPKGQILEPGFRVIFPLMR